MGPQDHHPTDRPAGLRSAVRAVRAKLTGGRLAARGQMLVLFVVSIFVLTGITAIVVDVSWYWANTLRVQRAADAAALAGVVDLPGNPTSAYQKARDEATKNGYTGGGSTTVTPIKDPDGSGNNRRLGVTISAPVGTFFMKIFGIPTITAIRTGKAEYVLPVPMGSPENYYGVFGLTRGLTSTTDVVTWNTTNALGDSGFKTDTAVPAGTPWTTSSGTLIASVQTNNNAYARTSTNNATQQWGTYGFLSGGAAIPSPGAGQVLTIVGLEVRLQDAFVSAACTNTRIDAAMSWNATTNWSTTIGTGNLSTNTTAGDYTFPAANGSTSTAAWGAHTWVRNDFSDANFRLRLTAIKGCATAGTTINLDMLEVRVYWSMATTTSTTTTVQTNIPDANLQGPGTACAGIASCNNADGAVLNPRGFWATMNTEGAENVNGDAFQPYWDVASGTTNPAYDADTYYNYAVEVPAGASGSVYVYDPVFCDTTPSKGTGDRWFGANNAVSSFYELYDTKNTLYDMTDDGAAVANSAGLFRNIAASDTTMGGSGGSECKTVVPSPYSDGRDYHNKWYVLASGLSGGASGKVYRIHTTGTDPSNVSAQRTVNGENSFALYSSIPGSRIYGLGAMQMFTPLTASGSAVTSEFYLAQLDAVHAGKTVEIMLWDPGDTNPLSASVQILVPNAGGWSATALDYTAAQGTTNGAAASCNALSGTGVTSIQTNVGATNGTFNGCWLTIQIPIPTTYTAQQSGWWKIRYTMNGNGTSNDVTTWKVQIRGNPVHLIVP
ncbi:MAG: pilus assembly protein TadG-related protein [Chloroflexota bacterium]